MATGVTLAPEWMKILPRMLRWQKTFKVSGAAKFINSEDGCTIALKTAATQTSSSAAKLPTGEFEEMVLKVVSQNRTGFDFVRAHPPVI